MQQQYCFLARLLVIGLVFFSSHSQGQPTLTKNTYRLLTDTYTLIEQKQYNDALEKLTAFLASNKPKRYDRAIIQQTRGILHQELAQYQQAIAAFKEALSLDILTEKINQQLFYQLAQLLIAEAAYQEGLRYLERWFTTAKNPTPESHILAAIAHYHLQQHRQLIQYAKQAVTEKKPAPLMWYELLLAGYYATDQYNKAIPFLIDIITKKPNEKRFWLQLTNSYQRINDTEKAAATYALAYQKGLFDEDDIIRLANHYLSQDMPYRAGMLLQQEMKKNRLTATPKNLRLLADSWLLAQEHDKAEAILLKLTAMANSAAYMQLGQLYIARHDWQQAYTLLSNLSGKPDKKHAAKIDLYLGIAAFNLQRYKASRIALKHALSDKQTKTLANWWLNHPDMPAENKGNN